MGSPFLCGISTGTIQSYKRSTEAWASGKFKDEIVPVEIPQKKGEPIIFAEDEEYKNVNFDRIGIGFYEKWTRNIEEIKRHSVDNTW